MSKARDLASGAPAPAGVSTTELGYVDGVTSAIQTQLNQKPEVVAGKNAVINGGFDIFQRSSTPTTGLAIVYNSTSTYYLDRWQIYYGTSGTVGRTASRQVTNDTTNLPNIQYCMRIARDNAITTTGSEYVSYSLETTDSIRFAGQIVTVSYYARKGALYSGASSQIGYNFGYGTGTDQQFNNGFTGAANFASGNSTLTTTWQRFTATGTIPATATQLGLQFVVNHSGTAGATDYIEITGVQLELGSTATPFSRNASTIQGELAACQRYYNRYTPGTSAYGLMSSSGYAFSTTLMRATFALPVEMRVVPTAVEYSTLRYLDSANATGTISAANLLSSENSPKVAFVEFTSTGMTANRPTIIQTNNSTSGYVGFTAEL